MRHGKNPEFLGSEANKHPPTRDTNASYVFSGAGEYCWAINLDHMVSADSRIKFRKRKSRRTCTLAIKEK